MTWIRTDKFRPWHRAQRVAWYTKCGRVLRSAMVRRETPPTRERCRTCERVNETGR